MFTPIIDLEVRTKATVLQFTDVTGNGTNPPDATKWSGAGLAMDQVTLATLTITDPNDVSYTPLNITATILANHPMGTDVDMAFPALSGQWVDGYYTAVYSISTTAKAFTSVAQHIIDGTVVITCVGHGLESGMKVTIVGALGIYDGTYDVGYINANTFYIVHGWTETDTGLATPVYYNQYTPFVFANVEMAVTKMLATFCNMDEGSEADEYLKQIELLNGLLLALRSAITSTVTSRVDNIYGRITRILDFNSIELTYT